jgi:hypothetical protein
LVSPNGPRFESAPAAGSSKRRGFGLGRAAPVARHRK